MPSKKTNSSEEKNNSKSLHKTLTCGPISPGPGKYKLKSLVGYEEHCHSKYRNPAYTIAHHIKNPVRQGPGPKYMYNLPGIPGYTFSRAVYKPKQNCNPAPTYTLPGETSPAFSIVRRPKFQCDKATPGPYDPPPVSAGPAFTFGVSRKDTKCTYNPQIRDVGAVTLVKPTSPAFTIVRRRTTKLICIGPGPKYHPTIMKKSPAYTIGVKHSECSMLPRTECDELC